MKIKIKNYWSRHLDGKEDDKDYKTEHFKAGSVIEIDDETGAEMIKCGAAIEAADDAEVDAVAAGAPVGAKVTKKPKSEKAKDKGEGAGA